uniref:Uncharacterized protein n=1 Tax=Setaria viridis TaxID=4556 RepID=A0A4U6WA13_SETVI|nr:hypothetical protein SEVIR_1G161800v2 [Setaria viridis]
MPAQIVSGVVSVKTPLRRNSFQKSYTHESLLASSLIIKRARKVRRKRGEKSPRCKEPTCRKNQDEQLFVFSPYCSTMCMYSFDQGSMHLNELTVS